MKTKKRKQWLLAVILATILIFPVAVRTEAVQWNVYYNLAVGDLKVSAWNADDILGDGTVSYDASAHTLYLKNAHIRGFTGIKYGEALEETDRPFTIVSSGNCTIETYDCGTTPRNIDAYAIRSESFAVGPDLNMQGSGTLNIYATNSNGWENGIAIGGDLSITGSLMVNIKLGRTTDGGGGGAGIVVKNGNGAVNIGGSIKMVVDTSGSDGHAFYKNPPVFLDGYVPRVRAGSSAERITIDKRDPAGEVYTKNAYVCIEEACKVHTWDSGSLLKAATCTEAGQKIFTCTVCKETKTEIIDAVGHIWDNGRITKEATTETPGEKTFTCTVCGKAKTETIPKIEKAKEPGETEAPQETESPRIDVPADPAEAPAASEKEEEILKRKADEAPKGSAFNLLQLRFSKVTRTSIQLKWTKVPGAAGYTLYGNRCGKVYKKLKSFSASRSSWTQKKLQKGKYYKYYIVATAKYGGVKKVIASSKTIHVATSGGSVGNYKSVKLKNVKNNTVSIKKGKSFTIKASAVAASSKLKVKQHRKLAYESTNPAVAKVSSKGIIKAVGKGTCYVYVYTQSGTFKRISLQIKSQGENELPVYFTQR